MVTITFPDRKTEKRALAFLLGRFSGRVLRSGEHLVPDAALEALAYQNIPFTVQEKTTYEQAALRSATPVREQSLRNLKRGASQAECGELLLPEVVFDEHRDMIRGRGRSDPKSRA